MSPNSSATVLVFSAKQRNSEVVAKVLAAGRIECRVCHDVSDLSQQIGTAGTRFGALVVTERGLAAKARDAINAFQDTEPVWSELPVVLLSPHDEPPGRERPLRNVILIRQPTTARQLLSVVHLALELRGHQFDVQDLLLRLEERRDWSELALVRTQQRVGGSEAAREHEELEKTEERLAVARRRLRQRREEDRLMLARELHDNIIQRLLYLIIRLAPGRDMARAASMPELQATIDECRREVHSTVKELRRLIRELRPAGLELGFDAALEPVVVRLAPHTEVVLETVPAGELFEDVRLCLYRVAQEALRNIEKHAEASKVRVAMRDRDDEVHLFVADDGRGFYVPGTLEELARHDHFGLLGIHEFVEGLGGDVKIRSSIGKGTCLRARVPRANRDGDRPAR